MILSMIHNVGKPFSIHKFHQDIKSRGYQIGKDLLYKYLAYIEDAYLAFAVTAYNKSVRKAQTLPKKIYGIDPGLIRALTLDYENNLGRLFEMVIYLDLRRKGYTTHYYVTQEGYEIDFLVEKPRGEKKLFQIAWQIENLKTVERKERVLKAACHELKIDGELVTLNSYLSKKVLL